MTSMSSFAAPLLNDPIFVLALMLLGPQRGYALLLGELGLPAGPTMTYLLLGNLSANGSPFVWQP